MESCLQLTNQPPLKSQGVRKPNGSADKRCITSISALETLLHGGCILQE
ncbi:hypothetical protein [Alistipes sp. ZOR0009]|nr:hypothetical protein [Alistipes sp. ZOR0009]